MRTYKRAPVDFVRGEGALLWDADGKEYLDFLTGISVCSLGHCHPAVVAAVQRAGRPADARLQPLLHRADGAAGRAALGVEPRRPRLLRQLRHRGQRVRDQGRPQARPRPRHRRAGDRQLRGRLPRPQLRRPGGDARGSPATRRWGRCCPASARCRATTPPPCARRSASSTAAVLIEPIQGEAGVQPISDEALLAARQACDEAGALLILDEIQTGMGRTGSLWAYEQTPVRPDVITSAKALGGGMPIGACITGAGGRPTCSSPATTARPSPAARSPPRRRWRCSTSSTTRRCCGGCASWGRELREGLRGLDGVARGARPRPDGRRRPGGRDRRRGGRRRPAAARARRQRARRRRPCACCRRCWSSPAQIERAVGLIGESLLGLARA